MSHSHWCIWQDLLCSGGFCFFELLTSKCSEVQSISVASSVDKRLTILVYIETVVVELCCIMYYFKAVFHSLCGKAA